MTKKIFRSIIFGSVITLIVSFVFIMGILYEYFNNQLLSELRNEATLAELGVEEYGVDYLENIDLENRVTWIDKDGTVLYDTTVDAAKLENHADREEFKEAVENGSGSSQRYSDTLAEKIVYYALKLDDGTVIRISSEQYSAWALIASMLDPLIFVFVIIVIISILLANLLSKKIVKPLNEMNIENPDIDANYPEVMPLVKKIRKQHILIERQMTELKKNEEEFRAITSNMQEGFIIIDTKTLVLSFNNGIEKLFDVHDIKIGDSVFTIDRSEAFRDCVESSLKGKRGEGQLKYNGKIYQLYANPVFEDGNVRGSVLLIVDVTEKEKREELRREFTSNVSHELKTPLTSIFGISEIIMNGIVKSDDIPKFAKDIHNESGRLITLVNDIIKLSKLDEGAGFGDKQPVDIFKMAQDTITRLDSMAQERNITVKLTGEKTIMESIPAVADEIIHNVIENAIKYNKENGSVDVFAGKENGWITFRVKDTGIGIPDADINRVFERFYRVDKSHSRKIGGTGLGLSIVKHGVSFLGGELSIKSKVNEGTTITIVFK
ncbi:sensor histidine kinase [Anaerotignum sp. MSJ-24]|uniref:sensor histidine kinase n=1 Tax=Anaerotignum sp. MSJ-24 TaxID=2841521 RepID=UPI001C11931D|nr:ATP-binding protein [Anaerotignum sp. MSJ-24]MBU5464599.1 PAS domain-containing protein [Anaerotignum sp. MSJ-24]